MTDAAEVDFTPSGVLTRGSDDEYCAVPGAEGLHHYVSHSVDATPIRFVDRCSLCGHISSRALRRQLDAGGLSPQSSGRGTIF